MTLTVDQLEVLVTEPFVNGSIPTDILDAIILDFSAMRQPITAEALTAAGWKHKAAFDDIFAVDEFALGGVRVRIGGGLIVVGVAGRRFDGVSNMYDLAQLVRLLGGVA